MVLSAVQGEPVFLAVEGEPALSDPVGEPAYGGPQPSGAFGIVGKGIVSENDIGVLAPAGYGERLQRCPVGEDPGGIPLPLMVTA